MLITGLGSGMGRSLAQLMAERGATVIVHDVGDKGALETARMMREDRGTVEVMTVDVRDIAGFRDALTAAVKEIGAVDIRFNNAGVGGQGLVVEGMKGAKLVPLHGRA